MSPRLATNFGELHRQIGHFGQTGFNLIDATKFVTLTDKLELEHYTLQYRQCRERALQRSGRKSQHLLCPVTLLMTLSYLPAQITNRNTLWATTQIISLGEKLLFCTSHVSLMMVVTRKQELCEGSNRHCTMATKRNMRVFVFVYTCRCVSVCGPKTEAEVNGAWFYKGNSRWSELSRNSSTKDHSE